MNPKNEVHINPIVLSHGNEAVAKEAELETGILLNDFRNFKSLAKRPNHYRLSHKDIST